MSSLKTKLSIVNENLFLRKDMTLTRVCLVRYLPPASLEVQQMNVLENPVCFLKLDLKAKLISSESIFMSIFCGMVVCKVLKSKVEIDLALFLKMILFNLLTIREKLCKTRKSLPVIELFSGIKSRFEDFGY